MNTAEILHAIGHREYPISTGPWVMSQLWLELLFAHWPIKPDLLRFLIPSAFTTLFGLFSVFYSTLSVTLCLVIYQ